MKITLTRADIIKIISSLSLGDIKNRLHHDWEVWVVNDCVDYLELQEEKRDET